MELASVIGLTGAIVLVAGAAYPERTASHPAKSAKNWLFAIGGLCMLAYAILNYLGGGTIFFVILQLFINATSILMMLGTSDKFDTLFITVVGLAMVLWSLSLFEGTNTVFFIIGLTGIGLGYAMDMGTFKRNAALTAGSALIALFSYIAGDWIFFWLNVFFALFSGYHAFRLCRIIARTTDS